MHNHKIARFLSITNESQYLPQNLSCSLCSWERTGCKAVNTRDFSCLFTGGNTYPPVNPDSLPPTGLLPCGIRPARRSEIRLTGKIEPQIPAHYIRVLNQRNYDLLNRLLTIDQGESLTGFIVRCRILF